MPNYIPPGRVRRIAALSLEIELLRNRMATMAADLERLDATVERLGHERRRAITRDALAIIRRAGKPIGLRAIVTALVVERGMDGEDRALLARLMEQVRVALTRQWQHGIVTRKPGPGVSVVWGISG
jgi:hypothetical protein